MTAQPRKPNHDVLRVILMDLEKLPAIHDRADHVFDVIRLVRIIGDDAVEGFVHAQWIVGDEERRILHVVLRQVAQHFADQEQRIGFAIRRHMAHARLFRMHARAAQFLLRHLFVGDGFHYIGSRHEHVRGVARHEDEIGESGGIHRAAGARSHDGGNLRNDTRCHCVP